MMQPKKKFVATILQMVMTNVQHLSLESCIVTKMMNGSLKLSVREHRMVVFLIWQKDTNNEGDNEGDKVICQ